VSSYRTHLLFNPAEKIAIIAMTNAADAKPYRYSYQAYDLVGPAIVDAVTPKPEPSKPEKVWQKYLGRYADPSGWEYQVIIHNGRLVLYEYNYPPEDDALDNLTEHTFRMADGENVVFELDKKGNVIRVRRRYDFIYPKK
jgi:hypothetical protein